MEHLVAAVAQAAGKSVEEFNREVEELKGSSPIGKLEAAIDEEKAANADMAFNLMVVEGEAYEARQEVQVARQEVADLNFTLMINGVI